MLFLATLTATQKPNLNTVSYLSVAISAELAGTPYSLVAYSPARVRILLNYGTTKVVTLRLTRKLIQHCSTYFLGRPKPLMAISQKVFLVPLRRKFGLTSIFVTALYNTFIE